MVKKKFKESLDHKSLHHHLVSPTMITDFGAIYGIGLELSGIQEVRGFAGRAENLDQNVNQLEILVQKL